MTNLLLLDSKHSNFPWHWPRHSTTNKRNVDNISPIVRNQTFEGSRTHVNPAKSTSGSPRAMEPAQSQGWTWLSSLLECRSSLPPSWDCGSWPATSPSTPPQVVDIYLSYPFKSQEQSQFSQIKLPFLLQTQRESLIQNPQVLLSIQISLKSLKRLKNPEFWSKILCQNPKKPMPKCHLSRPGAAPHLLQAAAGASVFTSHYQPVAANDGIMMGYGISNMAIVIVMVI